MPKEVATAETAQLPAIAEEQGSLMNLIADLAKDPQANVDKLEKLIAMKERVEDRAAMQAFAQAYVEMKPKLPKVVSTHKNSQTSSKYAKLEDINAKVDPILKDFGFATQHKVLQQTAAEVTIQSELWHKAGHIETTQITLPIDNKGMNGQANKTALHGIASTITYGRRLGVCALLNISTGDDTDGNQTSDSITEEQAAGIEKRAKAMGEDYAVEFLKWAKVEQFTDIPAKNLKAVLAALTTAENHRKAPK